jgi:hypothetical protein
VARLKAATETYDVTLKKCYTHKHHRRNPKKFMENKPVLSLQDISVHNVFGALTHGIYAFIWLGQNPSRLP